MAFVKSKASQWQSNPMSESNYRSIASSSIISRPQSPQSPPPLCPSKLQHFGLLTFHEKLFYSSRATSPSTVVFDNENTNTMIIDKRAKKNRRDVVQMSTKRYTAKTDTFDTTESNLNALSFVYNKHCRRPDMIFGITKNGSRTLRKRSPHRRNVDGLRRTHITGISDVDSNYLIRR